MPDEERDDPNNDVVWKQRVLMHLRGERAISPRLSTYNSKVSKRVYLPPSDTSVGIDPDLFNEDDDHPKVYIMTPQVERANSQFQAGGGTALYKNK